MKTIGNIIWLIFGGLESALYYFFLGLIYCITIIGIPFGKQIWKMGSLVLWPFGKEIDSDFSRHPIMNVIWIIFGGLFSAIGFFILGILYCITIIGIPFGKQYFKLAKLAFMPFGATIK